MKRHVYTGIALAVLAGPLGFSFEDRVHFWTHWPAVASALVLTGLLYLFWDAVVVRRGDWSFNPKFTGTLRIFGLPLGEILFFITVPYACLFVWEAIKTLLPPGIDWLSIQPMGLYAGALVFVGASWVFRHLGYTVLALLSVAIFLSTLAITHPALAGRSEFWVWWLFCFVAFAVVNGLYTALPTIFYNPRAIWGIRVGTIPLEDFFYNLGYLGLTLCFYLTFDGWFSTAV
jgi:lycopene cyclase domain-containing protein